MTDRTALIATLTEEIVTSALRAGYVLSALDGATRPTTYTLYGGDLEYVRGEQADSPACLPLEVEVQEDLEDDVTEAVRERLTAATSRYAEQIALAEDTSRDLRDRACSWLEDHDGEAFSRVEDVARDRAFEEALRLVERIEEGEVVGYDGTAWLIAEVGGGYRMPRGIRGAGIGAQRAQTASSAAVLLAEAIADYDAQGVGRAQTASGFLARDVGAYLDVWDAVTQSDVDALVDAGLDDGLREAAHGAQTSGSPREYVCELIRRDRREVERVAALLGHTPDDDGTPALVERIAWL